MIFQCRITTTTRFDNSHSKQLQYQLTMHLNPKITKLAQSSYTFPLALELALGEGGNKTACTMIEDTANRMALGFVIKNEYPWEIPAKVASHFGGTLYENNNWMEEYCQITISHHSGFFNIVFKNITPIQVYYHQYLYNAGALKTKKQRDNPYNQYRNKWHKQPCIVIARGKMNSCLIEFVRTGERIITSRNFLRKKPFE